MSVNTVQTGVVRQCPRHGSIESNTTGAWRQQAQTEATKTAEGQCEERAVNLGRDVQEAELGTKQITFQGLLNI